MRQLMKDVGRDQLSTMPKWHQLVGLRKSMQGLLPADHPALDDIMRKKKANTMDFNDMDVS